MARCFPASTAPRAPRRDLGDPERLVVPLGVEGLNGADNVRRAGIVLVDIIRGEEVLAVTRSVELVVESAIRVRRHGRDEFGGSALCSLDQGRNRGGGLSAAHGGCPAHVGEVGLVEGQHPLWRAVRGNHFDGGVHVLGKCHHGHKAGSCMGRSGSAGDRAAEGEPVVGGADGVEHAGVHAAVEGYGFHEGWTTRRTAGACLCGAASEATAVGEVGYAARG